MTYEYQSVHKWLQYHFPKIRKCERCGTSEDRKYEYALIKGKRYEKNRENFMEMCAPCHKIYDNIIERLTEKKYKPVYAQKNGMKYLYPSMKYASEITGVLRTSISNNIKGLSKTAGGYVWTIA